MIDTELFQDKKPASEALIPASERVIKPEQLVDGMLSLSQELGSRNMFCLHGIAMDDVGNNSQLPESTTIEDRFRIAIEDRPTLSTVVHSEQATNSKAPLWSNIGVMVGEGKLQAASSTDMSSVMLEGGNRQTPDQAPAEVAEALDKIAANDAKYPGYAPHNEVVVKDPMVSGLYFKDEVGLMPNEINRNQVTSEPGTIPQVIRDLSERFGLPIFAIRTTGAYQIGNYDGESGKYKISDEETRRLHPPDVLFEPTLKSATHRLGGVGISKLVHLG